MKRYAVSLIVSILFSVLGTIFIPFPCWQAPCTAGYKACFPDVADCPKNPHITKPGGVVPTFTLNAGELSANIAQMLERGG